MSRRTIILILFSLAVTAATLGMTYDRLWGTTFSSCTNANPNGPCMSNGCAGTCAGTICMINFPECPCNLGGTFCPANQTCTNGTCVENLCPCSSGCAGEGNYCVNGMNCHYCPKLTCLGNCIDGNVCTKDICDTTTGTCSWGPDDGVSCNDNDACTINDKCGSRLCTGDLIQCNDNNRCTNDSCNAQTGCTYMNNTAACDDYDACTENDACSNGSCAGGATKVCDDGNVCTNDSCDAGRGCIYMPGNNGTSCPTSDTDKCKTYTCTGGACGGGPKCPTNKKCNPPDGVCVDCLSNADCEDGDNCTVNECLLGKCEQSPLQCPPGATCKDTPGSKLGERSCAYTCNELDNPSGQQTICGTNMVAAYPKPLPITVCCGPGACRQAHNRDFYCQLDEDGDIGGGDICNPDYHKGCRLAMCKGDIFVCDDGDECTQDVCSHDGACDSQPWVIPIPGCGDKNSGGDTGTTGGSNGSTGGSNGSNGSTNSNSASNANSASNSNSASNANSASNSNSASNANSASNSNSASNANSASNSNSASNANSNSVANSNSASDSASNSNANSNSNSVSFSNSVSNSNSVSFSNSNSAFSSGISTSATSSSSSMSSTGSSLFSSSSSMSSTGSSLFSFSAFSSGISSSGMSSALYSSSSSLSLFFSSAISNSFSMGFCCVTMQGANRCISGPFCPDSIAQCTAKCGTFSSSSFLSGLSSSSVSAGYCCVSVQGKNSCVTGPFCTDALSQCTAKCVTSGSSSSSSSGFSVSSTLFAFSSNGGSFASFGSACFTDSQCPLGSCQNGICTTICFSNSQCGGGTCQNGICASAVFVAAASLCGNGVLETLEECDDSNRRSGDGCNDSCLLEIGICGDGKVQQLLGEQCEQSLHNPALPYGCRNCRFFSLSCGDGKLDPGEECDKGNLNSTSPNADCRPDCSLSRCGDGILDSTELCDDGNRRAGDGCDVRCTKETTLVASDSAVESKNQKPDTNNPITNNPITNIPFPYTQSQPYPYAQLPFASLQPLIQQIPTTTQSGPAAVAVIGAGAAAGFSWMRRRRK